MSDRTDWRRQSVDELVAAKGVSPIGSIEDLKAYSAELFESDEEVEEFLAFVRELRSTERGRTGRANFAIR